MTSAKIPKMKSGLLKKLFCTIASEGLSVFEAVTNLELSLFKRAFSSSWYKYLGKNMCSSMLAIWSIFDPNAISIPKLPQEFWFRSERIKFLNENCLKVGEGL